MCDFPIHHSHDPQGSQQNDFNVQLAKFIKQALMANPCIMVETKFTMSPSQGYCYVPHTNASIRTLRMSNAHDIDLGRNKAAAITRFLMQSSLTVTSQFVMHLG
jgi:hypothetical protein